MIRLPRHALTALALFGLCLAASSASAQAIPDTPLEQRQVHDRLGRTITYYWARTAKPAPTLMLIQGSGCATVLHKQNGAVYSSLFNLLPFAAERKFNVVAVEKPFSDPGAQGGTAERCPSQFNASFTAETWLAALQAVLTDVQRQPNVDLGQTIVLGHSEGAVMAAMFAGRDPRVTDAIVMSGSGTTQLFDFLATSYQQCFNRTECLTGVEKQVREINSDADSAVRFAWGHPFKRWSSFLRIDPGEELAKSRARVYLVIGTADESTPALSQEVMVARLLAAGHDVSIRRVPDAGHDLMLRGDNDLSNFDREMRRALIWASDTKGAASSAP